MNKEVKKSTTWHFKYRSIDGRGNNLKNPEWGASDTPFSRFGLKNYEDGIYPIKKSVTGRFTECTIACSRCFIKSSQIATAYSTIQFDGIVNYLIRHTRFAVSSPNTNEMW